MKKKHVSETARAVAQARDTMAPKVPCVNANAEGYCTGPCEGALCCKCADYKPAEVTAIAVRVDDLPMPEGSPAEQANALHREFLKSAKTTAVRAVQCGWVLSNVRASCGRGAWQHWVAENLVFSQATAYNYIAAYEKTVGAARAGMRRPVPLSVEPTMEEIESACSQVAEQPMTDLYRATGLVERRAGWGGAGRGQGRKPKDAEAEAAELAAIPKLTQREEAAAIWTRVMCMIDKTSVLDAVPLLPQKAAKVCYDRLSELAKAMKSHLEEF